jgi:RNase P/RNase MRP subunit p30
MNHVLAKQAAANETAIGFNFSLCYDDKRSTFLGRMQQNVRICRKYDVPMVIASFAIDPMEMRHPKDLEAFGRVIGMHQQEATDALQ